MKQILPLCLLVLALSVSVAVTDDTPQFSISPYNLDFGNVQLGDTKQIISYLTNVGNTPVLVYGVGGVLDTPFYFSITCEHRTLNPGESCETYFSFRPTIIGAANNYFIGGKSGQNYTMQLTGNGVAREYLAIGPSMLDFGDVQLGDSKQKMIYILAMIQQ